jgi:hypothetical protein
VRPAARRARAGSRRRRWLLVGLASALALLVFASSAIAPSDWTRRRLEASLSTLLAAEVTIQATTGQFPLVVRATGVAVSRDGSILMTAPLVIARPTLLSCASRSLKLLRLQFVGARMAVGSLDSLLALVSQPADRLPADVDFSDGVAAAEVLSKEVELTRVQGGLLSRPDGTRDLRLSFELQGQTWQATGLLRPMGDGALHLRVEGRSRGVFDVPIQVLKDSVTASCEFGFQVQGRLSQRALTGYYARLEAPAFQLHLPRWQKQVQARGLVLTADDDHFRLEEMTVLLDGTTLRLRASSDRLKPTQVTLEGDAVGLNFPEPPASGEASAATTLTLRGPWRAPSLTAACRLTSAPAAGPLTSFDATLDARLEPHDLRLSDLRLRGRMQGHPFSLRGSVTLPPWEPRNPIFNLAGDLPWLEARLLASLGHGLPATSPAVLSFKGELRGRRLSPQFKGTLGLVRGPLAGAATLSATIETSPDSRKPLPVVQVTSCTCLTAAGKHWTAEAPFGVALEARPPAFATPARFRAPDGASLHKTPGEPVATGW